MNSETRSQTWLVLISVWATFFLFSLISAPIPAANEPHYFCKARHYWQPEWCAADFFLESPNAHTVFYATVGLLTIIMPLTPAAIVGRLIAYLILAWGWNRCLRQIFLTPWAPLWCAWLFLALATCGNFSGEWLVGGVEGKVFAYAFLLAALGDLLRQQLPLAAVWAGLAISFHPVVGVWGILAAVLGQIFLFAVQRFLAKRLPDRMVTPAASAQQISLPWKKIAISIVILVALSLPGLVPVIQLLALPADAQTRFAAAYLQVFFRLAHHLDPMRFASRAYWGYGALLMLFLFSLRWGGRTRARRTVDAIVLASVVFIVAGLIVGWGPRPAQLMPYFSLRMNLLKFYPFRLGDVLLPLGCCISLICVLERTLLSNPFPRRLWPSRSVILMMVIFGMSLVHAHRSTESNRYSKDDRKEWLDICHWIDSHLPTDALVQSPTNGWAFKWFAQRAEFVAFKDCPQDAAGLVEWNRRLNYLQKWFEQNYVDQFYSAKELAELRRETGLTHILTDRLGPLELEPVYRNSTFQVYDLRQTDNQ